MNVADLISGFVNEQILGIALMLVAMGHVFTRYFGVDKKKIPLLFVVIALPTSIAYHICLNSDLHIYVNVINGLCQGAFSIAFSFGFYDLGKSLWKSLRYQIKKANPISKKQEENMQ